MKVASASVCSSSVVMNTDLKFAREHCRASMRNPAKASKLIDALTE